MLTKYVEFILLDSFFLWMCHIICINVLLYLHMDMSSVWLQAQKSKGVPHTLELEHAHVINTGRGLPSHVTICTSHFLRVCPFCGFAAIPSVMS